MFCNLIGDQAEKAAQIVDFYLKPGGYVFIADCLRCDTDEYDDLLLAHGCKQVEIDLFHQNWSQRYKANMVAGLEDGAFIVAKPGPNKARGWGNPRELEDLAKSDDFERLARHWHADELKALFENFGLVCRHFEPTIFLSREKNPLIGCWLVMQKPSFYKYALGVQGQELTSDCDSRQAFYQEELAKIEVAATIWQRWEGRLLELEESFGFPIFGEERKEELIL